MSNFYIRGYGLGVGIGKVRYMKVKLKKLFRCTTVKLKKLIRFMKNPGWYNFTVKKYQFSQKLPRIPFSGNLFFTVRIWQEINAALLYAKA